RLGEAANVSFERFNARLVVLTYTSPNLGLALKHPHSNPTAGSNPPQGRRFREPEHHCGSRRYRQNQLVQPERVEVGNKFAPLGVDAGLLCGPECLGPFIAAHGFVSIPPFGSPEISSSPPAAPIQDASAAGVVDNYSAARTR